MRWLLEQLDPRYGAYALMARLAEDGRLRDAFGFLMVALIFAASIVALALAGLLTDLGRWPT
jgi:hypothetical protein